jgi:hypothetical protein
MNPQVGCARLGSDQTAPGRLCFQHRDLSPEYERGYVRGDNHPSCRLIGYLSSAITSVDRTAGNPTDHGEAVTTESGERHSESLRYGCGAA